MPAGSRIAAALAVPVLTEYAPTTTAIAPLRRLIAPGLTGLTNSNHVALTFDDGPDRESTAAILATLAELDVRATFFVLGTRLQAAPELARLTVERGHELAVHGWTHRPHLFRAPWAIHGDLARTAALIERLTSRRPAFWRPSHGIVTRAGLQAARRLGLRTVLWSADGRDWQATATPASISGRITAQLQSGDVVVMHDSDAMSAVGSWRRTLAALPSVVQFCRDQGWEIGPLAEHGFGGTYAAG